MNRTLSCKGFACETKCFALQLSSTLLLRDCILKIPTGEMQPRNSLGILPASLVKAKTNSDRSQPLTRRTGRLRQVLLSTTTEEAAFATKASEQVLLTLARTASLIHAVDAIVAAAASVVIDREEETKLASDKSLVEFGTLAAEYAAAHPHPDWLNLIDSDNAFLDRLHMESMQSRPSAPAGDSEVHEDVDAFGFAEVLDRLKAAGLALAQAAKNVFVNMIDSASGVLGHMVTPLVEAARPSATTLIGRFTGDALVYIQHRGDSSEKPGEIPKLVIDALDKAIGKKTDTDDKLIVVAHSMGGNIIYDILTYYRPDIECDLLVTVGTQVGLFEEMKLFKVSDATIGEGQRVRRPANIACWLNVFDVTDIFGFTNDRIFEGVHNFEFDNETLPVLSHGMYFVRPRFHERLRARVTDLMVAEK